MFFIGIANIINAFPKMNTRNGVAYAIIDFMNESANDPKSVQYIEAGRLLKFNTGYYGQLVKFRARNGFGALVIQEVFYLMTGDFEYTKICATGTMAEIDKMIAKGEISIIARYDKNGYTVVR